MGLRGVFSTYTLTFAAVGTAVTAAATCLYATADLTSPLSTIAVFSLVRGPSVGMVFVSIQTAAYATTSMADTGRATSLFNTRRQVSYDAVAETRGLAPSTPAPARARAGSGCARHHWPRWGCIGETHRRARFRGMTFGVQQLRSGESGRLPVLRRLRQSAGPAVWCL